jgi:hypothetical protein
MQTLFKNKMTIGLVVVLLAGMFAYRSFTGTSIPSETESVKVLGQDLIALSESLSRVTLSQDLFSVMGYTQLIDFTVPPTQQSFGRKNPFDIIGRD